MATYYSTPQVFADFKTAYLQREVVLDVMPAASFSATVGQVFSMSGNVPTLLAVDVSAASAAGATASAKAAVAVGMYIIAQGDQTMEYGHVPVEYTDYKYNPAVNFAASTPKKVAAFMITNLADINIDAPAVSYSA